MATTLLTHQHDGNGSRTRITHPDGNQFGTDHDGLGRPAHLLANGATMMAYQGYYAHGGTAGRSLASGATSQWGYDGLRGLPSLAGDDALYRVGTDAPA